MQEEPMTVQEALHNLAEAIGEIRATYREHLILQESLSTVWEYVKTVESGKPPKLAEPANERPK